MNVVILSPDPSGSAGPLAAALADLGCCVTAASLDADPAVVAAARPRFVLVDAAEHMAPATAAIARLRHPPAALDVAIILLTTLAGVAELDPALGHDDFVLSPLLGSELFARLRQLDWRTAGFVDDATIKVGELVLDRAAREVRVRGGDVELTRVELDVLAFLLEHPGRVFSREELLARVWGDHQHVEPRTVDVHIRRIRAKLGPELALIRTVRHVGYKGVLERDRAA